MATRHGNDDILMDGSSQGQGHRFSCTCIDPMMLLLGLYGQLIVLNKVP